MHSLSYVGTYVVVQAVRFVDPLLSSVKACPEGSLGHILRLPSTYDMLAGNAYLEL